MTFDENGKHTETTTGKTTDGKDVEITTVYEEIKNETGKVISYTKTVTTRELTPESTTTKETGRTDVEGAEKPTGERKPDGDATTTISGRARAASCFPARATASTARSPSRRP